MLAEIIFHLVWKAVMGNPQQNLIADFVSLGEMKDCFGNQNRWEG